MNEDWRKDLEEDIANSKIKADMGDADAQFHCYVLLSAEAMSQYNTRLFDQAEKYLILAADQGHSDAQDRLKTQSIFRKGLKIE